jgi:predicted nucleic acid-binding protein
MSAAKIFFDTSPFIYLIENHADYYPKISQFLLNEVNNGSEFITNVLTYSEFCVKPQKLNRLDLIEDFGKLLTELDFNVVEIDIEVATIAYMLRAKYDFLKGIDAMQVASAIKEKCTRFLTNDKKLKSITEIEIVILDFITL